MDSENTYKIIFEGNSYITFNSDCNNEVGSCFTFEETDKNIICTPLLTQLEIDEENSGKKNFDTIIKSVLTNSDNFISQGSFNSAFRISNVTTESG